MEDQLQIAAGVVSVLMQEKSLPLSDLRGKVSYYLYGDKAKQILPVDDNYVKESRLKGVVIGLEAMQVLRTHRNAALSIQVTMISTNRAVGIIKRLLEFAKYFRPNS